MPTKKKTEKLVSSNKSWICWLAITGAKLVFALSFALALFMIYLDAKVQKTFEGQRWQVPAQIYGQIESFLIGDIIESKPHHKVTEN